MVSTQRLSLIIRITINPTMEILLTFQETQKSHFLQETSRESPPPPTLPSLFLKFNYSIVLPPLRSLSLYCVVYLSDLKYFHSVNSHLLSTYNMQSTLLEIQQWTKHRRSF